MLRDALGINLPHATRISTSGRSLPKTSRNFLRQRPNLPSHGHAMSELWPPAAFTHERLFFTASADQLAYRSVDSQFFVVWHSVKISASAKSQSNSSGSRSRRWRISSALFLMRCSSMVSGALCGLSEWGIAPQRQADSEILRLSFITGNQAEFVAKIVLTTMLFLAFQ